MNVWNFTGNIGKDAEQRFTPNKDSVVSFSVAVKSGFGDRAATTWVRCALWGKRGESVLPYLKKGQLVGVSGEAALRDYQKDGATKSSLEVRVNDVTLLSKAEPRAANSDKAQQEERPNENAAADFDSEIPF